MESDNWFKFKTQMITNYILNRLLPIKDLETIKEVLINTRGNFKEQAKNQ